MVQYALHHLWDSPEIASELGSMIVAWAYAEDNLSIVLHRVTGMRANMALAAYHNVGTFESRVHMITAAIEELTPDERDFDKGRLLSEIARLRKLAPTRNRYVHNAWQIDKDEKRIYSVNIRSKDGRSVVVRPADIKQHTIAVLETAERIKDIVGNVRDA